MDDSKVKKFQRMTAEKVFQQFYENKKQKVLVADEVGLGKTYVAIELINKILEKEKSGIKIAYFCPNLSISEQNADRLSKLTKEEVKKNEEVDRLTLLSKIEVDTGESNELFPMTVGTSFGTKSPGGTIDERAFIYYLLHNLLAKEKIKVNGEEKSLAFALIGLFNILRGNVDGYKKFFEKVTGYRNGRASEGKDRKAIEGVKDYIEGDKNLIENLDYLNEGCKIVLTAIFKTDKEFSKEILGEDSEKINDYLSYLSNLSAEHMDAVIKKIERLSVKNVFLPNPGMESLRELVRGCGIKATAATLAFGCVDLKKDKSLEELFSKDICCEFNTEQFNAAKSHAKEFFADPPMSSELALKFLSEKRIREYFIRTLRDMLRIVSLKFLELDLIIFDEFHRYLKDDIRSYIEKTFGDIYNNDSQKIPPKILLLSATPYKMKINISNEIVEEDEADKGKSNNDYAFEDFKKLICYIEGEEQDKPPKGLNLIEGKLKNMSKKNLNKEEFEKNKEEFEESWAKVKKNRGELQKRLEKYIFRTERYMAYNVYAADEDRFWEEVKKFDYEDELRKEASKKEVEYFKRIVENSNDFKVGTVIRFLKVAPYFFSFSKDYKSIEELFNKMKDDDALFWNPEDDSKKPNLQYEVLKSKVLPDKSPDIVELAWIPPSIQYYEPQEGSPFTNKTHFTKTLVFAFYLMSTRSISAILSNDVRKKQPDLNKNNDFTFKYLSFKENDKSLLKKLSDLYNPNETFSCKVDIVLNKVEKKLDISIEKGELERVNDEDKKMYKLASIGSPACCFYRLAKRVLEEELSNEIEKKVEEDAVELGEAFENYFKDDDIARVLSAAGVTDDESLLMYCINGNIQAVIDEYAYLIEPYILELSTKDKVDKLKEIKETIIKAIFISENKERKKTSIEYYTCDGSEGKIKCGFAEWLTDELDDSLKEANRIDNLKTSFNSPFYPFVLATTPIAQEGLDFHWYCHRIMHWHLPLSPAEFEQREGRINRFNSHMIRKRMAQHAIEKPEDNNRSIWEHVLNKLESITIEDEKTKKAKDLGLYPNWFFETPNSTENSIKLIRVICGHPLSEEEKRYKDLKQSLAIYRLSLGYGVDIDTIKEIKNKIEELGLTDKCDLNDLILNLSPAFKEPCI